MNWSAIKAGDIVSFTTRDAKCAYSEYRLVRVTAISSKQMWVEWDGPKWELGKPHGNQDRWGFNHHGKTSKRQDVVKREDVVNIPIGGEPVMSLGGIEYVCEAA